MDRRAVGSGLISVSVRLDARLVVRSWADGLGESPRHAAPAGVARSPKNAQTTVNTRHDARQKRLYCTAELTAVQLMDWVPIHRHPLVALSLFESCMVSEGVMCGLIPKFHGLNLTAVSV